MGGKKTETTSNQQQATTTALPEWMTAAGQGLYQDAASYAAANPAVAYTGPRVAAMGANQQQAGATAAATAGAWAPMLAGAADLTQRAAGAPAATVGSQDVRASGYQAAGGVAPVATQDVRATGYQAAGNGQAPRVDAATAGVAGYQAAGNGQAPQVQAGSVGTSVFDPAAASQYMSPYAREVQANTLDEMRRQDALDRASLGDGITAARAFGGSRQAVAESEQARNQATNRRDYIASSNDAAYQDARNQFNVDRAANTAVKTGNADRDLQAGTTNATFLDQLLGRVDAASQFNAGAQNDNANQNADRAQDASKATATFLDQLLGRTDAASQFSAAAANDAATGNANRGVAVGTTNANLANDAAGRKDAAGAFNATAANSVATGNAERNQTAQTTNGNAWEQMLSRMMGGGQQLGQLAETGSTLNSRDIAQLAETGATDQATRQAANDADYQEYIRMQNAPLEQFQNLLSILSGTPRNITTTGTTSGTNTTKQSGSFLNTALGLGQLGLSAYSGGLFK